MAVTRQQERGAMARARRASQTTRDAIKAESSGRRKKSEEKSSGKSESKSEKAPEKSAEPEKKKS